MVRLQARRLLAAVLVLQLWARDSIVRLRAHRALAAIRVFLHWARAPFAADADQDDNVLVADGSGDVEDDTEESIDTSGDDDASVASSSHLVDDGSDSTLEARLLLDPSLRMFVPPIWPRRGQAFDLVSPEGIGKQRRWRARVYRNDTQTPHTIASYSKQRYAIVAHLAAMECLTRDPLVELAALQDYAREKVLKVFPAAN
jgi:hypothetical protein